MDFLGEGLYLSIEIGEDEDEFIWRGKGVPSLAPERDRSLSTGGLLEEDLQRYVHSKLADNATEVAKLRLELEEERKRTVEYSTRLLDELNRVVAQEQEKFFNETSQINRRVKELELTVQAQTLTPRSLQLKPPSIPTKHKPQQSSNFASDQQPPSKTSITRIDLVECGDDDLDDDEPPELRNPTVPVPQNQSPLCTNTPFNIHTLSVSQVDESHPSPPTKGGGLRNPESSMSNPALVPRTELELYSILMEGMSRTEQSLLDQLRQVLCDREYARRNGVNALAHFSPQTMERYYCAATSQPITVGIPMFQMPPESRSKFWNSS